MQYQGDQAKAVAYPYSGSATLGPANTAPIKNPALRDRLNEMLNYLGELAEVQRQQREAIVGPEPEQESNAKIANPPSMEWLVARCCEMAAMAVSEARSIYNRL